MIQFYYYVPPCPECGSRRTGRFMKRPRKNDWYVHAESLLHGEIIRFANSEPIKNCFCLDCGNRWGQRISARLVSSSFVDKERKARQIDSEYERYHQLYGRMPDEKPHEGFIKRNFLW